MTSLMRDFATLPRLYIDADFAEGGAVNLPQSQAHYLGSVLRLKVGAGVRVFNGRAGEWLAEITQIAKREAVLTLKTCLRAQASAPDIWLLFAPVKKARTDFIIEKATELGAARIMPVITARTQFSKIRMDRMQAHIIEAAEQTERMDLPRADAPVKLSALLEGWDKTRTLIFADEAGDAVPAAQGLADCPAPCAILIGPEGGFSPTERERLRAQSFVTPISLGPRILRADTAALAALSLWQSMNGDW